MGFAAFLMAGGLVTLRSRVFARWTGVVALIGAVSFLVAFAAVLSGLGEDSLFGFGFLPRSTDTRDLVDCYERSELSSGYRRHRGVNPVRAARPPSGGRSDWTDWTIST